MVASSKRAHSELRKKPRRPLHYRARILIDKKGQWCPCEIEDISESGARILLQKDEELPKRFVLLLSSRGAGRICRQVWRDRLAIGVEFVNSDRA